MVVARTAQLALCLLAVAGTSAAPVAVAPGGKAVVDAFHVLGPFTCGKDEVEGDPLEAYGVEATVSDAESDDTASAGPVTVLNSPPTAPVVSITVDQPCTDGWSIMADGARCVTVVDSAGFTWFEARDACD